MQILLDNKVLAVLASVLLFATACSQQNESSSKVPAAEVKGEPIQKLADASVEIEEEVSLPIAEPAEESIEPVEAVIGNEPVADEDVLVEEEIISVKEPELIRSGDQDYLSVGFDRLASYEFEVTDDLLEANGDLEEIAEKSNSMIPQPIRNLNETSIALKGYMLPLKVEAGQVTEFLLMRDQSMCCFGTVPKINEWVSVKTIGSGVKPIMDEPVTIFGKLHVGEIRENGYLVGIYRMDGEKLADPLDL